MKNDIAAYEKRSVKELQTLYNTQRLIQGYHSFCNQFLGILEEFEKILTVF